MEWQTRDSKSIRGIRYLSCCRSNMNDKFIGYVSYVQHKSGCLSIAGKHCVVTGGSGRIGSVFTTHLLDCGAQVISLSRSHQRFVEFAESLPIALQEKLHWVEFDLASPKSFPDARSRILEIAPTVDILVNNASTSNRGANFNYKTESLEAEMWGVFGGSVLFTEMLLPSLRVNGKGLVINVGSIIGHLAPNLEMYLDLDIGPTPMLSCGKAAIAQYSSYLASREAKFGIRANTLIPGFFPRKGPVERSDYMEQLHHKTPLRRIGKLEDLVAAVAFLLSEGSSFFTGQTLIVDGGYSIW